MTKDGIVIKKVGQNRLDLHILVSLLGYLLLVNNLTLASQLL